MNLYNYWVIDMPFDGGPPKVYSRPTGLNELIGRNDIMSFYLTKYQWEWNKLNQQHAQYAIRSSIYGLTWNFCWNINDYEFHKESIIDNYYTTCLQKDRWWIQYSLGVRIKNTYPPAEETIIQDFTQLDYIDGLQNMFNPFMNCKAYIDTQLRETGAAIDNVSGLLIGGNIDFSNILLKIESPF